MAEADYRAGALTAWLGEHGRWVREVVTGRPGRATLEVRQWRWVAERTLGWFSRYGRLSEADEQDTERGAAWIGIAMAHRMSRFSLPDGNEDDDRMRRPPRAVKS